MSKSNWEKSPYGATVDPEGFLTERRRRLQQLRDWDNSILLGKAIAIVWTTSDVHQQAEDDGIFDLKEGEAIEVLSAVQREHDAGVGVNWEVLSFWIDEVYSRRS